jgi:hypothetical protein
MAEQSKFAGALGWLKQPSARTARTSDAVPPPPPEFTTKRGRGGKRSDPAYSPITFFVRKETKRKAAQLLLNGVAPDNYLSDIVEQLLAKWIVEHSNL